MKTTENNIPLVVHIVHRLAIGGMENGLINLINGMPADRYRHAIVCLSDYTDYRKKINAKNVKVYAMHKREGIDIALYYRVWKILKLLKPDIVHTRNLATIECQIISFFAGVKRRVHGEHGWNVSDLHGTNKKNRMYRRWCKPFINYYISLSTQITHYLRSQVKVSQDKIRHIYNGVDIYHFSPALERCNVQPWSNDLPNGSIIFGTVGRMQEVKDHISLIKAFINLVNELPVSEMKPRLIIVGDGPTRNKALKLIESAHVEGLIWLPGARQDIVKLLRCMDVFVMPSLAEGISNTILEAMATGLPVIATSVGGNPELVIDGETGKIVRPADHVALSDAMKDYLYDPALIAKQGHLGRKRVEEKFSLDRMVKGYLDIYDHIL